MDRRSASSVCIVRRPRVRPRPTLLAPSSIRPTPRTDLDPPPEPKASCVDFTNANNVEATPSMRKRRTRSSRWLHALFLMALLFLICPRAAHGGGGGAHASDGRRTSSSPDGTSPGTGAAASESPSSAAAVVICSVDGTVYTLDPWSGNLRGIFASGPALVSSSTGSGGGGGVRKERDREDQEENLDDDGFDWDENDSDIDDDQDSDGERTDDGTSAKERIVPGLDGNLYSLLPPLPSDQSPGLRLERLPISVADVIDSPISTCAQADAEDGQAQNDCGLVMGEKQTKIFRLDPATGRVVWMQRPTGRNGGFTAADSGMLPAGTSTGTESSEGDDSDLFTSDDSTDEHEQDAPRSTSVLLQREDYLLRSVDSVTGEERWNVTLGRFSALDFGNGNAETSDEYSRTDTTKPPPSSSSGATRPNQIPKLPHRLTEFDQSPPGSDGEYIRDDGEAGNAYRLDLLPLPAVAFGDDGTTIIAVDAATGKVLWQRELDSVVAAVYGVEQHGPGGGHTGGWTPLDVIDEFDLTSEGDRQHLVSGDHRMMLPPPHADLPPIERLTRGSKLVSIAEKSTHPSLPPSINSQTRTRMQDGVSNALIPYGYGHGALSGAALISEPPNPTTGMSHSVQHARIGTHSSTIFVASTSDSYPNPTLPFALDDTCESIEEEDEETISTGGSTSSGSSVDSIDFESLTPLLLEHGLLPNGAAPVDIQMYGEMYSSLLDAMQHTHRTNHGLFLSWRIVAIIACAVIGVVLGIRVGYNRQKKLWELQKQRLQSPVLSATQGIVGDDTPRSRDSSTRSPLYPILLKHVDSVPPLTDFDLPRSQQQRSPVHRSLSMPALHSSDPDKLDLGDLGDAFQEHTLDLKALAAQADEAPLLRATTIATTPTATTTAVSTANVKSSVEEPIAAEPDAGETNKRYTVDNLDGIPLVRYSRYSSEFSELSALGRGGFGTVFRCTNALDGRLYAIKKIRIKTQVGVDGSVGLHFKEKLHRVLREVKILALLDHPNIVRYYTAWLELEEGVEKNGDGLKVVPDQTMGRCYSSDLLTGASPSVSISSSIGPLRIHRLTRSPMGKKPLANPLGWNNFSGAFDRNSSIFEASEEDEKSPHQGLRRDTSDDDLGFTWERSSSGLSLDASVRRSQILKSSKMTSDLSVVGDDEKEEESGSGGYSSGSDSSSSSSSRSSLSEVEEHPNEGLEEQASEAPPIVTQATNEVGQDQKPIEQEEQQMRNQRHILYIQMQLCSQKTLADFLSNPQARKGEEGDGTNEKKIIGGIDLPHALHLFTQIARGVKHVHKQGLIHRDLKPMNCFIDEAGNVKIGDFGLSRESANTDADAVEVDDLDTSHHNDRRASLGAGEDNTVGVGTRSYASPEQMSGSDYDASTDIYSLGIILFELCYPMYTGMERHMVFRGIRQRSFPDQWNETVAKTFPSLHELLLEMLSPNPEDRPTSEAVVERVDTMVGQYTCDLLGLDFDMYQKLRQLDRATRESGRQRSSSIGGSTGLEEKLNYDTS